MDTHTSDANVCHVCAFRRHWNSMWTNITSPILRVFHYCFAALFSTLLFVIVNLLICFGYKCHFEDAILASKSINEFNRFTNSTKCEENYSTGRGANWERKILQTHSVIIFFLFSILHSIVPTTMYKNNVTTKHIEHLFGLPQRIYSNCNAISLTRGWQSIKLLRFLYVCTASMRYKFIILRSTHNGRCQCRRKAKAKLQGSE